MLADAMATVREKSDVLGILVKPGPSEWYSALIKVKGLGLSEQDILNEIAKRQQARQDKDYEQADNVRKALLERGIVLEDTPSGTDWSVKI